MYPAGAVYSLLRIDYRLLCIIRHCGGSLLFSGPYSIKNPYNPCMQCINSARIDLYANNIFLVSLICFCFALLRCSGYGRLGGHADRSRWPTTCTSCGIGMEQGVQWPGEARVGVFSKDSEKAFQGCQGSWLAWSLTIVSTFWRVDLFRRNLTQTKDPL